MDGSRLSLGALAVLLALAASATGGLARELLQSQSKTYWAVTASTPKDPGCNSTKLGTCANIVGAPDSWRLTFKKAKCLTDGVHSWMPTLNEPRYVDLTFEAKPTIVASRVASIEVATLNVGELDPAIASVELLLAGDNRVTVYTGVKGDNDSMGCPAVNLIRVDPKVFKPAGKPDLSKVLVQGLRLTLNSGVVKSKIDLPSISAVGLSVVIA